MAGTKLNKKQQELVAEMLMNASENHDSYPFEVRDCSCQMPFIPIRVCSKL